MRNILIDKIYDILFKRMSKESIKYKNNKNLKIKIYKKNWLSVKNYKTSNKKNILIKKTIHTQIQTLMIKYTINDYLINNSTIHIKTFTSLKRENREIQFNFIKKIIN